ncbi:MAG: hypothetical protein LBL27_01090 [Coriobacteriales bacterium]|jgi:hypothetical protein|nr:hypothetical protein [Coriobacteriales bacterium]
MYEQLSGGAKFGYFCAGFFLSLIGFTIIWAVNKDRSTLPEALKFGVIGAWAGVAATCVCYAVFFALGISIGMLDELGRNAYDSGSLRF